MNRGLRPLIGGAVTMSALCTLAALAIVASSFDLDVPDSWDFRADLLDAVDQTMQPANASVWLRERAR